MQADHEAIKRRLKTARGQIDGLIKMVEEDRYCIDISTQVMAAEAMEQAIYQILHTERFAWPIYSWNYGAELGRLTGRSVRVAQGELPRLLREALTQDARITGVRDVTVTQSGKREALVHFTAETVFGDVDAAAPLRLGTV